MNNFELDKKAKELMDTETHYNLARRVVELEDDGLSKKESKMENEEYTHPWVISGKEAMESEIKINHYFVYFGGDKWSYQVSKENGIETTGNPTFEEFNEAAGLSVLLPIARAMYHAAWPEK